MTQNHQKKIVPVVFEQSSVVGGTWVYNEKTGQDQWGLPVHSSMYKSLKTNLPKEAMAFPDFPFEDTKESFLHHSAIRGICLRTKLLPAPALPLNILMPESDNIRLDNAALCSSDNPALLEMPARRLL